MSNHPERRSYVRKKSTVSAVINYGPKSSIPCTLLEVAGGGARILVSVTNLPKSFKLFVAGNGRVARDCEVIWQRGLTFGLRFKGGVKI